MADNIIHPVRDDTVEFYLREAGIEAAHLVDCVKQVLAGNVSVSAPELTREQAIALSNRSRKQFPHPIPSMTKREMREGMDE